MKNQFCSFGKGCQCLNCGIKKLNQFNCGCTYCANMPKKQISSCKQFKAE